MVHSCYTFHYTLACRLQPQDVVVVRTTMYHADLCESVIYATSDGLRPLSRSEGAKPPHSGNVCRLLYEWH